jgi:predicted CXXCH cytochrome family protein
MSTGCKKAERAKRCIAAALAIIFSFMLSGCNSPTGHQVISFFFDGVPSPKSDDSRTSAKDEKPREDGADPQERKLVEMVQHPPFAERLCDNCHKVPEKKSGVPVGFSLLEEREQLCQMCHDDMSPESLAETYDWVHGPVQYGACIKCHHPHESPNPFMLRNNPIRKLCLGCHDGERLLKGEIHSEIGNMDCSECHEPHGSQERFLMKM